MNVRGTPHTNRGVQNTEESGLRSLVDWVSVTFKHTNMIEEICILLGCKYEELNELQTGLNGYKTQHTVNGIRILSDGRSLDMGIHVIMSGQACRNFENYYSKGWRVFFVECMSVDAKFTRLDLAVDDFKGYFKVKDVLDKLQKGLVSSKMKQWRHILKGDISSGKEKGLTVYMGSPQSDIEIVFYEKLFERISAGKEVEEGVTVWNRTELRLSDKRAQTAVQSIVYEHYSGNIDLDEKTVNQFPEFEGYPALGVIVARILKNYMTIFEKRNGSDSNKARWPRWKRFEKYLGEVERLKLTLVAPDKTIERTEEWLNRQTLKALAEVWSAHDYQMDMIVDMLNSGLVKMDEISETRIRQYKINKAIQERDKAKFTLNRIKNKGFALDNEDWIMIKNLHDQIERLEQKKNALMDERPKTKRSIELTE